MCNTDWQAASITHPTAQQMMVRELVEREGSATRWRAVLDALIKHDRC